VILDAALLTLPDTECAQSLADAGVRLLQYRNKSASSRKLFDSAKKLSAQLRPRGVSFVVNDRADVAALVDATGIHVGQQDLSVENVRRVVGPSKWVGVSTHNREQFERAAATSADYIAVGPVYSTSTKTNPDPVIGIDFIRMVRTLTDKPIVAIGGITLDRASEVIRAGADSIAVISDILLAPDPGRRARQFLDILESAKQAAAV
jgi:thiamine-phosphate pyrophosphorylase